MSGTAEPSVHGQFGSGGGARQVRRASVPLAELPFLEALAQHRVEQSLLYKRRTNRENPGNLVQQFSGNISYLCRSFQLPKPNVEGSIPFEERPYGPCFRSAAQPSDVQSGRAVIIQPRGGSATSSRKARRASASRRTKRPSCWIGPISIQTMCGAWKRARSW